MPSGQMSTTYNIIDHATKQSKALGDKVKSHHFQDWRWSRFRISPLWMNNWKKDGGLVSCCCCRCNCNQRGWYDNTGSSYSVSYSESDSNSWNSFMIWKDHPIDPALSKNSNVSFIVGEINPKPFDRFYLATSGSDGSRRQNYGNRRNYGSRSHRRLWLGEW